MQQIFVITSGLNSLNFQKEQATKEDLSRLLQEKTGLSPRLETLQRREEELTFI